MARAKLGDMLSVIDDATADPTAPEPDEADQGRPLAAVPEATSPDVDAAARPAAPPQAPATGARPAKPATDAAPGPRYLELIRKEARLTDEQLEALNVLTRQLNKARRGSGERITDNTLIRVAVDLLLHQRDQLAGVTENELRKSVGL